MILKIIGILALIFMGVMALLVALVAWALKFKTSSGAKPSEVHLSEDPSPEWLSEAKASAIIKELESMGFEAGGTYIIDEMPEVSLKSLCKDRRISACLYMHDSVGIFVDLCLYFEDGNELTVTSAPVGGQINTRPKTEKIFLAGFSVQALYDEVLKLSEGKEVLEVSNEGFVETFENCYRKDMSWVASQGGVSEEEIRRVAESEGKNYDEAEIQNVIRETKLGELRQWEDECIETLEKTMLLTAEEWEKYEGEMMIFKEDFHPEAYVKYISWKIRMRSPNLEPYIEQLSTLSLHELLLKICTEHNANIQDLGQVDFPVKATVYGIEQGDVSES